MKHFFNSSILLILAIILPLFMAGCGGGWRMPTMDELRTLYKKGAGSRNMTPLLKTTGWWVWSGETEGSSYAWYFTFNDGGRSWSGCEHDTFGRAFAVGSRSDG